MASRTVAAIALPSPSLDLGAGNGIFSFITAGGELSEDYDWYRNVNPSGFWEHKDIYDCFVMGAERGWIRRAPQAAIDCAADLKASLLGQAASLDFYRYCVVVDAALPLPFADRAFSGVFSNMLYWLPLPAAALSEIARVLRPGGRAVICVPDDAFCEMCPSYQWKNHGSELLRLLNRGRADTMHWTASLKTLEGVAKDAGLRMIDHCGYLSPLTLQAWDIGLRPLSAVLVKLIGKLTEADRGEIKREWMEIVRPFLVEMCEMDAASTAHGFHVAVFEPH